MQTSIRTARRLSTKTATYFDNIPKLKYEGPTTRNVCFIKKK
jgi:hypothetical protein